jgi:hypothetical protein
MSTSVGRAHWATSGEGINMSNTDDFPKIIEVLDSIIRTVKGRKVHRDGELDWAMEGAIRKFYLHCMSVQYLMKGTTVPEVKFNHLDGASINVLIRAALETFLVFHYNFIEPDTEDEKLCRYWSWCLKDLHPRQNYIPISQFGRDELARERDEIKAYQDKLKINSVFQAFSEKQQRKILDTGEWPLYAINKDGNWFVPGLTHIGISAGIHEQEMSPMYNFLCGYAHASYWSIRQLNSISYPKEERYNCDGTLSFLNIVAAFMIRDLVSVHHLDYVMPGRVETYLMIGEGKFIQ